MSVQPLENQSSENQNSHDSEKPFVVERPHELNALMKALRDALTNSASQQTNTEETKPVPSSDDQETSEQH